MKITDLFKSDQAKLLDTIQRDCSVYIQQCQQAKNWLYRGMRHKSTVGPFATPVQRTPKDSEHLATQLFDHMLKKIGATAVRSNSIFVTGDIYQAESYNIAHVIFPKNSAHYTWTNNKDLILRVANLIPESTSTLYLKKVDEYMSDHGQQQPQEIYQLWVKFQTWMSMQLRLSELLNNFDAYHLPQELRPQIEQLIPLNMFKDAYEPQTNQTGSLVEAIKSGKEILVHGEYYALVTPAFDKKIIRRWGVNIPIPDLG
jgi:hypothetical protein